jgi:SWIM zinc finger
MASNVSHPMPSAQAHAIADLTGYEDAATLRWQQACVQAANTLTALPNGRYVNVRMERMRQGLELAQRGAVTLPDNGQDLSAVVRSGSNLYQIDTRLLTCTCADYQKHLQACKHLLATEVHLGALGLVAPATSEPPATAVPEEPAAAVSAPGGASEPRAACPTTASWPISEAPASLNIKLRVGNMELMYTMRDVDDLKLQRRATMSLPWLTDILHGCEANLAARQQEAERTLKQAEEERQAQARSLDEQIAAAVAAAMKAQANGKPTGDGARKPPAPPALEPTTDTDPSWCPIHRCKMERRSNERGSWYSHRLSSGAYCKGE